MKKIALVLGFTLALSGCAEHPVLSAAAVGVAAAGVATAVANHNKHSNNDKADHHEHRHHDNRQNDYRYNQSRNNNLSYCDFSHGNPHHVCRQGDGQIYNPR